MVTEAEPARLYLQVYMRTLATAGEETLKKSSDLEARHRMALPVDGNDQICLHCLWKPWPSLIYRPGADAPRKFVSAHLYQLLMDSCNYRYMEQNGGVAWHVVA